MPKNGRKKRKTFVPTRTLLLRGLHQFCSSGSFFVQQHRRHIQALHRTLGKNLSQSPTEPHRHNFCDSKHGFQRAKASHKNILDLHTWICISSSIIQPVHNWDRGLYSFPKIKFFLNPESCYLGFEFLDVLPSLDFKLSVSQ